MLSRPFIVLFASVFVATMGISMVSPLLPVYAEELGATGIWIGLTFSVFAITQTIFGPFAGRWSDRYGRKPFIVAGLLIYFVAALGYLTANSFYQVLAFRALSGMGTSLIFSVARAYVGDMVPPGHEGRWFGMFATADIIGFGIGPLLAGIIRGVLGFDAVFVAMAALMISSAGIVSVLLPASGRPQMSAGDERKKTVGFIEALRNRLVFALTLNMALISVTFGATFSFLAVMLEDDLGIGPILIGLAFGAESIAAGVSQPFVGRLADIYSRRLLVAIGLGAAACVLLGIGLTTTFWVIILLLVMMGIAGAVSQVANSAMQVVAGRHVGMGTVIGLGSAGNGVGIVFGSVAGGVLVDWYGISAAFFFGGFSMLAGIPLFLWLTRGVATTETELPPVSRVESAAG
jgi:MFS transporter, DHA1 family, multidrug resistance protein